MTPIRIISAMASVQNCYWQILVSGSNAGFRPMAPAAGRSRCPGGSDFRERLAANIADLAGEGVRDQVMGGGENLTSCRKKARWLKDAMARLEKLVPDRERIREIMARSACPYPGDRIRELKALFVKTRSIDRVLEEMNKDPFYAFPARIGGAVYMTKLPRDKKAFGRARTGRGRRIAYCHCEYARAVEGRVRAGFCLCGSGWYRQLWSGILGVPVRVESVRSVLRGDDCCTFAIDVGPARERNMRAR